jgi:hypothetical protein
MNPKVKKVLRWGFVLPFWIGVGALMLLGVYQVSVPARGRATLSTQCFGQPSALTASANGAVVETVPLPKVADKVPEAFVYNVEGVESFDVVDHSAVEVDGGPRRPPRAAAAPVAPRVTVAQSSSDRRDQQQSQSSYS